ncbi:MAG: hypothetical protein R3Y59_08505 [bacterium]
MAGVFRFSNAVSDIDKFISTYKSIYNHFRDLPDGEYFDHSDAAIFMAKSGLASSLGAIGEEALRRSTRDDKSRDPLFNQHKSYSEMFRMLGWYEPGSQNTNFALSEFGEYINDEQGDALNNLVALNTIHIASPNPLTNVKGNNILRPFPLILKLASKLGGLIHRDEIIVAVLACENDKAPNIIENLTDYINTTRSKGKQGLVDEIEFLKKRKNIKSKDTLPNYTRFPIAALKWNNWMQSKWVKGIYGDRACLMLEMTPIGEEKSNELSSAIDIRYSDIAKYDEQEIASFVIWSNLYQLEKIGYDMTDYAEAANKLKGMARNIFKDFEIDKFNNMLFFGYQEAPRYILNKGNEILDKL